MFKVVTTDCDIRRTSSLASEIWREYYPQIIGADQVEYMLDQFQSAEAIRKQIHEGRSYALMLENDVLSGYLAYDRRENIIFLSKLYVHAAHRRRGWSSRAIDWIEAQEGRKAIQLTVNRHNEEALTAYAKLGFKVVGKQSVDIGQGFRMDDFVLERPARI